MSTTATDFLDEAIWRDNLFCGSWQRAAGGTIDVQEPATQSALTRVALANAADVAESARVAAAAQPAWAEKPYQERAAIFREAARLVRVHADEIKMWMVRETGSIPPKIDVELNMAEGILYQAVYN